MGLLDSIKGMFKKHEAQVDQGIDKAEDAGHDQLDDTIGADKIDTAAEHAHDAADKLADG